MTYVDDDDFDDTEAPRGTNVDIKKDEAGRCDECGLKVKKEDALICPMCSAVFHRWCATECTVCKTPFDDAGNGKNEKVKPKKKIKQK
jgi:predicted sulfurtransferase